MCDPPVNPQIWKENDDETKRGGVFPPFVVVPQTFFTQSVPTPWVSVHVITWRTLYATVHILKLSNTVHTTPITPTNHDHAQIYFPFVYPFQIEPNCVCMFPFIHVKLSFPHSFPNLN
jgi:hypothetical protein